MDETAWVHPAPYPGGDASIFQARKEETERACVRGICSLPGRNSPLKKKGNNNIFFISTNFLGVPEKDLWPACILHHGLKRVRIACRRGGRAYDSAQQRGGVCVGLRRCIPAPRKRRRCRSSQQRGTKRRGRVLADHVGCHCDHGVCKHATVGCHR